MTASSSVETSGGLLCEQCRTLFEALVSDFDEPPNPFHADKAALQRSLDAGCSICTLLPWDLATFKYDEVVIDQLLSRTLSFTAYTTEKYPDNDRNFRLWFCEVEEDEALLRLCQKASLEHNSGSHGTLQIAAVWVSRCIQDHPECRANQQPECYPSRILDIQNESIRLVDTRQSHLVGPYATLSHSWGGATFEMLTSDTLLKFSNGLYLDRIPATFHDAIIVARTLGISYLWIDCYCIMQSGGPTEEKQQEIARMGDIYSNAVINIGAAAAKSPMDGCFTYREPRRPVRIEFVSHATGEKTSYLIYNNKQLSKDHDSLFARKESSIFSRAWCMQERFLSPRMLHFCRQGMFWECQTLPYASEFLPIFHRSTESNPFALAEEEEEEEEAAESDEDDDEEEVPPSTARLKEWCHIVSMYSVMDLSFPLQDKFAACGGVAKLMASLIKDEYIAGFFRESLVNTLAWIRAAWDEKEHSDISDTKRATAWRAPSWSWASMNGGVEMSQGRGVWSHRGGAPQTEIVSLDHKLVDPTNPYGALQSAKLVVKGPATEVKFAYFIGRTQVRAMVKRGVTKLQVYFDDPKEQPWKNLIILITTAHDERIVPEHEISGLVLAPFKKKLFKQAEVYKRVGAFQNAEVAGASSPGASKDGIHKSLTQRVFEIV